MLPKKMWYLFALAGGDCGIGNVTIVSLSQLILVVEKKLILRNMVDATYFRNKY